MEDITIHPSLYNKRALIIDDKANQLKLTFVEPLKRMGFEVELQVNPEVGALLASHRYSVIFIDFKFDNVTKLNGTDICYKIRRKCPLSIIILVTGFGKENLSDISHADWDGYIDKNMDGVKASEIDILIAGTIHKAIERRGTKVPLLELIPHEEKAIEEKIKILNNLNSLYQTVPTAVYWNDEAVARHLGFNNRTGLSQKFTCQNTDSWELKKDALIFRHVLLENPDSWESARRSYPPLMHLLSFFGLE